jgi:hypothetical protein
MRCCLIHLLSSDIYCWCKKRIDDICDERTRLWIFLLFIDRREKKKESIRSFFCLIQWITYREYAIKIQTSVLFSRVSFLFASDMYISIDLLGRNLLFYIEQQEIFYLILENDDVRENDQIVYTINLRQGKRKRITSVLLINCLLCRHLDIYV